MEDIKWREYIDIIKPYLPKLSEAQKQKKICVLVAIFTPIVTVLWNLINQLPKEFYVISVFYVLVGLVILLAISKTSSYYMIAGIMLELMVCVFIFYLTSGLAFSLGSLNAGSMVKLCIFMLGMYIIAGIYYFSKVKKSRKYLEKILEKSQLKKEAVIITGAGGFGVFISRVAPIEIQRITTICFLVLSVFVISILCSKTLVMNCICFFVANKYDLFKDQQENSKDNDNENRVKHEKSEDYDEAKIAENNKNLSKKEDIDETGDYSIYLDDEKDLKD